MERKVTRICSAINLDKPSKVIAGGHLSVKGGQYEETKDIIRSGVEDQIRFVLSVLGFGSPADYWKMNTYEFYRDFVRAYTLNKDRNKKAKNG